MGTEPQRNPLDPGRGVVQIEDFCSATGLEQASVEHLMRTELREAALWRDEDLTRPFGIFDDMLPSREALTALALPVREDYQPGALRGFEMTDDEPEAL